MTVKEIIKICGGYNFTYSFTAKDAHLMRTIATPKYFENEDFLKQHSEILDKEVSHLNARGHNHFEIIFRTSSVMWDYPM